MGHWGGKKCTSPENFHRAGRMPYFPPMRWSLLSHKFWICFFLAGPLAAQSEITWAGALPEAVQESSGLLRDGPYLITHNDSGNPPELFVLDTASLDIVRRGRVTNAPNKDWEDIAQDDAYFYIGDFGNNLGSRKDLRILRISKEAFAESSSVEAGFISFSYEDQTDFSGTSNSDWDAEALLVGQDSLWVFTKQWQSGGTTAYGFPKQPGTYVARRAGDFPVRGLITGASPIPGDDAFLLLGYSGQLQPFLLHVPAASPAGGFPAGTAKVPLDIPFSQAEGVAVSASGTVFISTESFSNEIISLPAGIFRCDLDLKSPDAAGEGDQGDAGVEDGLQLVLSYTPDSGLLRYRFTGEADILAQAVFDTSGRRVLFQQGAGAGARQLDVSSLESAIYYLTVYLRDQRISRAFLRF